MDDIEKDFGMIGFDDDIKTKTIDSKKGSI